MTDTLSDVLRAVRLTGAVFFAIDASAPWVAETPAGDVIGPHLLPGVEHVIDYHVVRSGSCWGFQKTENSIRKWCTTCGGHLLTEHPAWGLVDVYAAVIPEFPFEVGLHANYENTVLRLSDGRPKQRDFPKEMGGSGVLLPE